jgi:feruloyl esterase
LSLAKNVEFLRHFPKLNGFNGLGSLWPKPLRPRGGVRWSKAQGFGTNPGALKMFAYVPEPLPRAPALVVVLHGCGQTAAAYDFGTGWSTLAKRYGFALLMPEQQGANNANTCFNWFNPGDCRARPRRSRLDPADGRADGRRSQDRSPAASISPGFPPAAR